MKALKLATQKRSPAEKNEISRWIINEEKYNNYYELWSLKIYENTVNNGNILRVYENIFTSNQIIFILI